MSELSIVTSFAILVITGLPPTDTQPPGQTEGGVVVLDELVTSIRQFLVQELFETVIIYGVVVLFGGTIFILPAPQSEIFPGESTHDTTPDNVHEIRVDEPFITEVGLADMTQLGGVFCITVAHVAVTVEVHELVHHELLVESV